MAEKRLLKDEKSHNISVRRRGEDESSASTDFNGALSRSSLPISRHFPIIAIALLGCVTAFLIIIVVVDVPLRKPGVLSNDDRALYVTGTALLASLISSFASGQIKLLWTAKLLDRAAGAGSERLKDFAQVRTLLGLGKLRDQFRFWISSGSVILLGLITTAIVAGITPSISQVMIPASISLNSGELYPCFGSTDSNASMFNWTRSDGSSISLLPSAGENCPITSLPFYYTGVSYDPVYEAGGVGISRDAIGTPFSTDGNAGFEWSLGWGLVSPQDSSAGLLLQKITACAPVVAHNPVSCSVTGNLTVGQNEITAVADGCTIKSPILGVDPTKDGASSVGVCTAGLEVGKATIVIGAVNDHAANLSSVIGSQPASPPQQMVVACHVDVAPSIDFRSVVYTTTSPDVSGSVSGYAWSLTGNRESCQPVNGGGQVSLSDITVEATLAYGAAASYRLLTENAYKDGWWPTLYKVAEWPGIAYGASAWQTSFFNESTSGLEMR